VLDIGSGTGFYVERWLELKARDVTGIDITEIAVEHLRDRYPSFRFERRDIGAAGDLNVGGPFDIVSAFDVLFHIVDDERYECAFQNIRSALRTSGWFIFSENFLRRGDDRARHQVSRSQGTIERVLEATGFREVYRRPMSILMDYPIDQPNRLLRNFWRGLTAPARLGSVGGHVIGAALYPFELALTSLLPNGPSAKVVVCRCV
jgi:SAM-dependent methyltransferase